MFSGKFFNIKMLLVRILLKETPKVVIVALVFLHLNKRVLSDRNYQIKI